MHKIIHFKAREATKEHVVVNQHSAGRGCTTEDLSTALGVGLTLVIPEQFKLQFKLWKLVENFELGLKQIEVSKI